MSDTSSAENTAAPAGQRVRRQVEDALELANLPSAPAPRARTVNRCRSTTSRRSSCRRPDRVDRHSGRRQHADDRPMEQVRTGLSSAGDRHEPGHGGDAARHARTARPPGKYAARTIGCTISFGATLRPSASHANLVLAFAFVVVIIALEWTINYLGLKKDATAVASWRFLWQSLVPWAYGALGACAFMLRSAHYFIHQRSFDTRRTPEYFNRILLGAISAAGSSCSPSTSPAPTTDRSRIWRGRARLRRGLQRRPPVQYGRAYRYRDISEDDRRPMTPRKGSGKNPSPRARISTWPGDSGGQNGDKPTTP